MKSSDLRNVVLLGHGGVGKTSCMDCWWLYSCMVLDSDFH